MTELFTATVLFLVAMVIFLLIVVGTVLLVLAFFFGPFAMLRVAWLIAERKRARHTSSP